MQAYAKEHGMQLSLTKEGMYPEFSLDGIPYKAYRNPGKYRDEVCCDAVHPEQLDTGLPSRRERQLQVLRILLPAAFTFCRHSGGRLGGDRRSGLALAGSTGSGRGPAWPRL